MTFDPFGDFSTRGYLRNSFGIRDKSEIKAAERTVVQINMPKAIQYLAGRKDLSYGDVLEVHSILFGAIYPWAGEDRTATAPNLDITKAGISGIFAHPDEIQMAMNHGLRMASDTSTMRSKPGEVMGYMAYSHPFLDGNGRTIMAVHQEMCRRAGFHIDWMKADKAHYLTILTQELQRPGKGFLDDYVRQSLNVRGLNKANSNPDGSYEAPAPKF